MKKITFISKLSYNYFFPGNVREAGGHTRIYQLARKLAEYPDYEVGCVVGDFGQPDIIEKDGVKLYKAPIDKPLSFLKVISVLKKIQSDVFIDFIASPRLLLLYFVRKLSGAKYIFLTGSDTDVNGEYGKMENFLFFWVYLMGLKKADGIVCQLATHVDLLKKKYKLNSHLVLSPYFDIFEVEPIKKEYILWVGRAADYKRPELFIDIVRRYPERKFVMICNESSYDNGFMNFIRENSDRIKNLIFYNYVPYPQMADYYRKAQLLVNTSDFEGFPNTFIEAAMHYTPIFSLNTDPNGMLSEHECGQFFNGDFSALIDMLEETFTAKDRLKNMGKNAYRYAKKNHQLYHAVEKFDRIIRDLIDHERNI